MSLSRRAVLRRLGGVGLAIGAYTVLPAAVRTAAPAARTDTIEGLPRAADRRSEPVATPIPFSLVGFELLDDADVEFRASPDGDDWTPWTSARRIAADGEGPDTGSQEDASPWRRMTHPVWVGEARWLQVRGGDPREVRAQLIDSVGLTRSTSGRAGAALLDALVGTATAATTAAAGPDVISRSEWGADESWRQGEARYAAAARFVVIHHTATSSSYSRSDVPAILRGIYRYHTQTLGWADIGYNLLVDRFGRVFEGRAGGIDRAVIGAHAAGYNDGSVGVAALGNYDGTTPPDTLLDGLDRTVAWKLALHDIHPGDTTAHGSSSLPTIVGHRDVGATACPGGHLYRRVRGSDPMSERVWVRMLGFHDVPATSPFARDIAWIAAAGITTGTGPPERRLYRPRDPVTREQMAAFLSRALQLSDDRHPGFSDVAPGSTFDRDIRRVAAAGIAQGTTPPPDAHYRPRDPVTREQMAAFLHRALTR